MIFCKHCGATQAHLEPIIEHLENGITLQTVRCIKCGERRSRIEPRHGKRHAAANHLGRVCLVEGCQRELAGHNTTGLCTEHGRMLWNWQHGKQTLPAPLVELNGRWIINPERVEGPACASAMNA